MAPEVLPHTSNQEEVLKGKETNTDSTSYKCTECTKCFKDPDVFILHKRCHTRDIKTNKVEKENFNINMTLRSNPILANLLKTNNDANFDPNTVTMESFLMTALAANMDYIRNLSMNKEERDCDRLNHERGGSNYNNREVHSRSDPTRGDGDEIDTPNRVRRSLSDDKGALNYSHGVNQSRGDINHHNSNQNTIGLSYAMNFATKLDRSIEKTNNYSNFYKETFFSSEYERGNNNRDDNTKGYDENDSASHCDNDLNESLDSNSLVIDETV